jgi:hypothetical protein
MREVRDAIQPYPALGDRLQTVMRAPDITIRVVEVSFGVLPDKGETVATTRRRTTLSRRRRATVA